MADFACMHVWLLQEYGDRVMIPVTSMIEVIHHMVFGELWVYMGRLLLSRVVACKASYSTSVSGSADCPPPIPDIVKGGLPPGGLVGLGFSVRFSDRASSSANSEGE